MASAGTIITFYSYKGGTGRSMALANVACLLARQQKRVLMIDWDLDAPGLHRFFHKQLRSLGAGDIVSEGPGLIDMFLASAAALDASGPRDSGQAPDKAATLIGDIKPENYILRMRTDYAELFLLKAGRFDENYSRRVGDFEWRELFERSPGLIEAFAAHLAQHYDYVLIDSRSGITDIGGICTMLMPHKLVSVFTPNVQSLTGVAEMTRRAVQYRAQSDDLRPLVAFPLPSRVEMSEIRLREQWRFGDQESGIQGYQPFFEGLFRDVYPDYHGGLNGYFDEVQVPHVPRYAYGEAVAVLEEGGEDRLSLNRTYRIFTEILVGCHAPWQYQR